MKKALISTAAVAALLGAGVAQAETVGYGLVDLAFGTNFGEKGAADEDAGLGSGGNSGTRFGVKGGEDLGSGLKSTFNLEAGWLPVDENDTSYRTAGYGVRQAWIGLAGSFGEVRYGNGDSVPFLTFIGTEYNGASNTATTINGTWAAVASTADTIQYFAPDLNGLKLSASYSLATTSDNDPSYAVGATYTMGAITVAAAFATLDVSDAATDDDPYMGFEVQYALNESTKVKVGYHTTGDPTLITLGGVTAIEGINVGAAYSIADSGVSGADTVGSYEVFANKELAKNLIGYAEVGGSDADGAFTKYAVGVIYLF